MGIIKNEKRPWLEDDPEMQNRLWVEERQEDIKKILPKEQPIDRIPLKCHELVIAPAVFFVLFFAVTSRRGLVFPFGTVVRYWFFVFIFSILLCFVEIIVFRKSKGYIEIYSEMMVVYEYDETWKKLYFSDCYDWKDMIQYGICISGIDFEFMNKSSVFLRVKRKKVQPYLEQYAPQAKKITCAEHKRLRKEEKK